MRISCDLDDTIISQYSEVLKILNERHNLNIDYNKIAYWNYTQDNYDEIDIKEILDIVYNFKSYRCQPVDQHLTKYFNKLTKENLVDVVTARWGDDNLNVDIWVTLTMLKLKDYRNIILSGNNHKQNLNYDIYIDDSPNLAKSIIGTEKILILYNQPWNWFIECDKHWNIFRARDWKQVYKIIKSL